ncbi:hypothetical protein GCM10027168_19640 [Streptomyces capparidis]
MSELSVDPTTPQAADPAVHAVLQGGPGSLTPEQRTVRVTETQDKIKIEHYGGYEHFERAEAPGDAEQREAVVYRWAGRTRIAE